MAGTSSASGDDNNLKMFDRQMTGDGHPSLRNPLTVGCRVVPDGGWRNLTGSGGPQGIWQKISN